MENVVLSKSASASSFVAPYSPSRAVDGSVKPLQRWLCNTVPCNMVVDLKNVYYINNWIVTNMAASWGSSDYALHSYSLQVSMDGVNWSIVDSVSNNSQSVTNRSFTMSKARYVRVNVTSGLRANPNVASIVELQVMGTLPTSALLTKLELSNGVLNPNFVPAGLTYTSQVSEDVDSITITPTAQDPNASITVNEVKVASGTASASISLKEKEVTPIKIEVTPVAGDKVVYTVNVTRCSNAQLDSLKVAPISMKLIPNFASNVYQYTITTKGSILTLTPTSKDPKAKIRIGDAEVENGISKSITLESGLNVIKIVVTPEIGTLPIIYTIEVTKN